MTCKEAFRTSNEIWSSYQCHNIRQLKAHRDIYNSWGFRRRRNWLLQYLHRLQISLGEDQEGCPPPPTPTPTSAHKCLSSAGWPPPLSCDPSIGSHRPITVTLPPMTADQSSCLPRCLQTTTATALHGTWLAVTLLDWFNYVLQKANSRNPSCPSALV